MEAKEFFEKLNLMVVTIKDNWLRIIALKYHFHQLAEFCFVELKTKISHQEVSNVTNFPIPSIWKNSKLMIIMAWKKSV